eukprot:g11187.t1
MICGSSTIILSTITLVGAQIFQTRKQLVSLLVLFSLPHSRVDKRVNKDQQAICVNQSERSRTVMLAMPSVLSYMLGSVVMLVGVIAPLGYMWWKNKNQLHIHLAAPALALPNPILGLLRLKFFNLAFQMTSLLHSEGQNCFVKAPNGVD